MKFPAIRYTSSNKCVQYVKMVVAQFVDCVDKQVHVCIANRHTVFTTVDKWLSVGTDMDYVGMLRVHYSIPHFPQVHLHLYCDCGFYTVYTKGHLFTCCNVHCLSGFNMWVLRIYHCTTLVHPPCTVCQG